MAHIQKDRSVFRPRAYYTVHAGSDRFGKVLASISKAPGRGTFWTTRTRDPLSKEMQDDLGFLSFAEARAYVLRQAAILECWGRQAPSYRAAGTEGWLR
jgi:hypothetical protein